MVSSNTWNHLTVSKQMSSNSSKDKVTSKLFINKVRGYPCGVMFKAMDCGIVVNEFVIQSHYYVYFRANTLGKGMNPLILPAMG